MKGIVFTEFFEFVESKDGYEMVDSVLQDTGSSGVYTAVGSYPFEEMLSVVVAYSKRSATEITDILYQFGRHLLRAFHTNYNFFFSKSQSAFEFLNSIDGYIHIEVAKLYPDAQLPTFSVSHHTEKKMELIYESERKLAHLALGLIDETLLYFKEEARVDMVALEEDHSKVKFTITKI